MSSSLPIPIPDLRFESSFRKTLELKASQSVSTNSLTDTVDDIETEPKITALIVAQVIIKDIILIPLTQGILLSSLLIVTKPWLLRIAQNGRAYGVRVFNSLGFRKLR